MANWKRIKGFFNYEVSDSGVVRNSKTRQIIKPTLNYCGYQRVGLYHNGKTRTILLHRIVAESFIENINDLPEVNHLDGDKTNNKVSNLEWSTRIQNMQHASKEGLLKVRKSRGKITEDEARIIRGLCMQGETAKIIAKRFNCSLGTVYAIGGKNRRLIKL